jgi:hypothetical protein
VENGMHQLTGLVGQEGFLGGKPGLIGTLLTWFWLLLLSIFIRSPPFYLVCNQNLSPVICINDEDGREITMPVLDIGYLHYIIFILIDDL